MARKHPSLKKQVSTPATAPKLPAGKFPTVLVDPPWQWLSYSTKGKGRSAEAHYDCMSLADIMAMPVGTWAARDAVLFLWTTDPLIPGALEVIKAWEFTFKTVGFYWAKTNKKAGTFFAGMGKWTRSGPEICLLATRGRPHRINANVRKLIVSPRREHSRKPDETYERIERLVAGPYLELFARDGGAPRPGWVRWVGKAASTERRWRSDSYPGDTRHSPGGTTQQ